MKIFTHFESVPMRWNIKTPNPKNYPYKDEFLRLLRTKPNVEVIEVVQQPIKELMRKVKEDMVTYICVDSFLPHLAHLYGKLGFVIFGQSDPKLFGYPENVNILKDPKYLRPNQFWNWEQTTPMIQAFPTAQELFDIINQYI